MFGAFSEGYCVSSKDSSYQLSSFHFYVNYAWKKCLKYFFARIFFVHPYRAVKTRADAVLMMKKGATCESNLLKI